MKRAKSVCCLSLLLALLMTVSLPAMATEVSREGDQPGYNVVGTYSDQTKRVTLQFNVSGLVVCAGRFALDYDETKVQLVGNDYATAVQRPNNIRVLVEEGIKEADLISASEGYLLFAWSPTENAIDTTDAEYCVATVAFTLNDGVTPADFDRDTFRLQYVGARADLWNPETWDSAAWLMEGIDNVFSEYFNCVKYQPNCAVSFTYPGSDRVSGDAYAVKLQVVDSQKQPLAAHVQVVSEQLDCDSTGSISLRLTDGFYRCKVTFPQYEELIKTIWISGQEYESTIYLRASYDLLKESAKALKIGYAKGDSAQSVRYNLLLPTTADNGCTVQWTSSVTDSIVSNGSVFQRANAVPVTLTAKVMKDNRSESRDFQVTVAAKSVAPLPPPSYPDLPADPANPTPETPTGGRFEDLGNFAWAEKSILALAKAGVINGTTESTYSPAAQITRGDFLALLMRMLKPTGTPGEGFSDVPETSHYYNEITLAKALGITTGLSDNRFNPTGKITRQDMMTLTYRALLTLEYLQPNDKVLDTLDAFSDKASVGSHATEAMANLVAHHYIAGNKDGTLTPLKLTNRAEAAVFLYRIYQDYN